MKKERGRFVNYLKRNALYLILALCIVAVGLSITLMLVNRESNTEINNEQVIPPIDQGNSTIPDDEANSGVKDPVDEPVSTVITFVMPVSEATEITEYSEDLVFNPTLNRFESHKAVDFYASEGTDVLAVSGGTILSVENSFLEGYTITIDHGNGLKSVYNSLSDSIDVVVGQTVNTGDVIGEVSVSNRKEDNLGAHLHFYMIENGTTINPEKYLNFENK